jgi:hypothetical protein
VDRTKSSLGVRNRLWRLSCVVAVLSCASTWCSSASADENASPPSAAAERSTLRSPDYPACRSGLRLSAVLYDAKSGERSFAVFGMGAEQRPQVFRRGARIAGYEIASIEQGAVVLTTQAQRCSVRLRGASVEHELRVVAVATVRRGLQAHKAAVQAAAERALPGDTLARNGNLQARAN